jgi:DNA-binding CsgD family transcriptional regulator
MLLAAGLIPVMGNRIQRIGQIDIATLANALRLATLGVAQTLTTWFEEKERLRSAVLRLTPVPRDHAVRQRWPAAEVLLLVELVDTPQHRTTLLHATARRYQLTPAETSLLEQLVGGATLAEAAQQQQVRITTVRTHMAHLLAKTDSRRQSDLMLLLSL